MGLRSGLCSVVLICAVVGCGGSANVGTVTGKVTLDGQPLPDALVTFSPAAGGSPSAGRTDDSGLYSLRYTRDVAGAEPGEHLVRVSTLSAGDPDSDPPTPRVPESVPAKYNKKSKLVKTVTKGANTIDLALESDEEVTPDDKSSDGSSESKPEAAN